MVVVGLHTTLQTRRPGLRRALAQRGLEGVTLTGAAADVVRHACDSSIGAAVAVAEGLLDAATLRVVADAGERRPDLAVVVVGPINPDVDVLVALASGVSGYLPDHAGPATVADAVVRGGHRTRCTRSQTDHVGARDPPPRR